jgi:hypothetical protein
MNNQLHLQSWIIVQVPQPNLSQKIQTLSWPRAVILDVAPYCVLFPLISGDLPAHSANPRNVVCNMADYRVL